MSELSISPYFPFRRIRIVKQAVNKTASKAVIDAVPDKRFHPVCHLCGQKVSSVHSWTQRSIRDLNLAKTKVWIRCEYRKLFCANCQRISIEDLEFFQRVRSAYLNLAQESSGRFHVIDASLSLQEVQGTVDKICQELLECWGVRNK